MRARFSWMLAVTAAGFFAASSSAGASPPALRYVAPLPLGSGSGLGPANAANYLDVSFWDGVQATLLSSPVKVVFLDGTYQQGTLWLIDRGRDDHRLVLEGQSRDGVHFLVANAVQSGLHLRLCRNTTVRWIHFSGPGAMDYAMIIRCWDAFSGETRDILIEECSFVDLPNVMYGASGAAFPNAHHVTYRRCVFQRVGPDAHAHMMYHTDGTHHINVIGCHFEDCAGDYVRFRDLTDFCVVKDCTFLSTSNWPPSAPISAVFVSMPIFNDVNPGDEYFGSNFVVCGNSFTYQAPYAPWNRKAIAFHHYGFDAPGMHYLFTAAEGAILASGTPAQKSVLLLSNCGIDLDRVRVFDNAYGGTEFQVAYGCFALYGATSAGWDGFGNIADAVSAAPLAQVYVDGGATGAEDGTSWADAYTRIQQGIDAATPGATVLVAPGVYRENVQFDGHDITVRGSDPSGSPAGQATVLEGFGVGSVVTFETSETAACRLAGLAITNGFAAQGGGIRCEGSAPTVADCVLFANHAERGGGIHVSHSVAALRLVNVTLFGNEAAVAGGGLAVDQQGDVAVANAILWGNLAPAGPEAWLGDSTRPSTLSMGFSDVEGGLASVQVEPGCVLNWGGGMIAADPLFAGAVTGDLHILHPSPCREAGDGLAAGLSASDFEGDPRVAGNAVDLGADEFHQHLWFTGDASPGGSIELKLLGAPGAGPLGLLASGAVLSPPLATGYGDWYLGAPLIGPWVLPAIPPAGMVVLPATLPPAPPGPYRVFVQAVSGAPLFLTNLCEIAVE